MSPEGAVTAEANSGYALSGWTALMDDMNISFADLNEIRSTKYEHDVVFAAQWSAAGGNTPDTGGNSSSGSSGDVYKRQKQDHTVFVKADKTLYTLTARADENSWINPQTKSYEYKEFILSLIHI